MNANSPLSKSENKPFLSESARAALTGPDHGGFIYPVDRATCGIDPAFDGMDLWDRFLDLHERGGVPDLGFKLPDPAMELEGYYMARSRHLPRLGPNDPPHAAIANLETQWRIKWLRDLMACICRTVPAGKGGVAFSARELSDCLRDGNPSLVPQKSWRCRGQDHTRIGNELMELLVFSSMVEDGGNVLAATWGHRPNPYGKGNKKTPIFTFGRRED